jgi:hypothetical protein
VYHRLLLEKISRGPHYVYCDVQDAVMRIEIENGEIEVYVRYRNKQEFKAAYDSKLVGIALSKEPVPISKEEYDNFFSTRGTSFLSMLNLVFFFTDPILDLSFFASL